MSANNVLLRTITYQKLVLANTVVRAYKYYYISPVQFQLL